MLTSTFGETVRQLRAQRQISQRELARRAGVTAAYISDIERQRRNAPSKALIQKLASILMVEEERLFDLAGLDAARIPPDVPEIVKRHSEVVMLLRSISRYQLSDAKIRELTSQIGGAAIKAIILAAGLGSRMKHMTQDMPKAMSIVLEDKTLLETQLETLRSVGITDISIVRGYCAEKIDFPGVRYFLNDDFANNNILESLFYAESKLDGDTIISYSDIWYEADVVKRLMRCENDIAIGVDIDWKDYYLGRKEHPIEEAENVIFNSNNEVIKIGKIAVEREEVHGEFIGMMKLTHRGCQILKRHYHHAQALYDGRPFQRAKAFKQAYLTDLLQEMADLGVPVHCEIIGSAWKEIDTIEDFKNAVAFFRRRR